MKNQLRYSLLLLLLLFLTGPARAATPPPTTGPSLATALNPDGTLRPGAAGSFDARQFRMSTAPDGRPVFRPAGTKGAGDERWANGFGLANGTDGTVGAIVQSGANVYIGGEFRIVGGVATNSIAKWNGTAWSGLGTGVSNGVSNAYINALAVAGNGDVYAGGTFTQAGGVPANYIAKWNGTAWSSLGTGAGNGVNGRVYTLAVAGNGDVYAGGAFTQAGGTAVNSIAKWNGTAWSSLGTGVSNSVNNAFINALAVASNGDVYAGGNFTQAGGTAANYIAKWNGTAWSSLGTGAGNGGNGRVYTLAVAGNGDVYAGGIFTQAGGVPVNNVAKWNGTAWSSLGTGVTSMGNTVVTKLALASSGDVYVGGNFTQAGGITANNVAKWNGTAWSSLGAGAGSSNGYYYVYALAVASSGDVYVGGPFTQAGGTTASNVAKWNGTAWSSLGTGLDNGVNSSINALAVAGNGDVYVGGLFTQVGGVAASYIAKWNGTAWSSLGTAFGNGVSNYVLVLAAGSNGDVYVGGTFTQAGGITANYVAKWDGTAWSSLGTGTANGVNAIVNSLAVAGNGDLYAGGSFTRAGGVTANRVAKWDGTAWSSLGTGVGNGVDRPVDVLAVASNGDVYAGGDFTQAGGAVASNVAKWDGTAWSSLGTGFGNGVNNAVKALAVSGNGDVYVGGAFTQVGGITASNVARWNGTAWSSLGTGVANGVDGPISALAVAGSGDVYVGGFFTQAGGVSASNVAKWSGTAWSSLGTGLNYSCTNLAIGPIGKLNVGGNFTATGDGSKPLAHFAIYDPNAPLATKAANAAPAALFPNPAHGTATLRLPAGAPRLPLTLTDALGRTVRRYPAPATSEAELDLRGLPAGVYVVRCGAVSQRLVVE